MSDRKADERPRPSPYQGVGKSGRSRRTWNAEPARSNRAALTNFRQQR